MKRALLSVYNKSGLVELARQLQELGVALIASGGTAAALKEAGVEHEKVEDLTGFPQLFDGRVKTLHPKVHGAILADRSKETHLKDLSTLGVEPIDLVISNLYPFQSDPSIEMIDIGGPAMVRGAAKNHAFVTVVVDPSDYQLVIEELQRLGETSLATRKGLAAKAFAHTAAYDQAVTTWLSHENSDRFEESGDSPLELRLRQVKSLKYGENPHQQGGLYIGDDHSMWSSAQWLAGPEPSYLNIFDVDAAWRLVHEVSEDPAVVIVKHANPCGVAMRDSIEEAYELAFGCDPVSAFGGIVAFNRTVTTELASLICDKPKADVLAAPGFDVDALEMLRSRRSSWRLVQLAPPSMPAQVVRSVGDAFLVQSADEVESLMGLESLTDRSVSESEWDDLQVAWLVCARTSSNAITIVRDRLAIGIGCGQQNRVDSARLAVGKAGDRAVGAVAASDAFFPFPDGLEVLAAAGVTAVVAPSGSIRDAEIVDRARELGISYVFAGRRHFRH